MDYAEHEATYRMFLSLAKGVVVFVVLLMIFMALFLL